MEILRYAATNVPEKLRLQVLAAEHAAWPTTAGESGHDPDLSPYSLLLVDADTVLSSLTVLSKEVIHAGEPYFAGGLSSVVTARDMRGRGYGHRLVVAAREYMQAEQFDIGLFTCDRPLQEFYKTAGWTHLVDSVLIGGTAQHPFPSDSPGMDKVTMADFMSERARNNRELFYAARIHLYPGDIDRLW